MLKGFYYSVSAKVEITPSLVDQLIAVALKHYDHKCIEAATTFLRQWREWNLKDVDGKDVERATVKVSSEELDTICKILEQEWRVPGAYQSLSWREIFRATMTEWEKMNGKTQA